MPTVHPPIGGEVQVSYEKAAVINPHRPRMPRISGSDGVQDFVGFGVLGGSSALLIENDGRPLRLDARSRSGQEIAEFL